MSRTHKVRFWKTLNTDHVVSVGFGPLEEEGVQTKQECFYVAVGGGGGTVLLATGV